MKRTLLFNEGRDILLSTFFFKKVTMDSCQKLTFPFEVGFENGLDQNP